MKRGLNAPRTKKSPHQIQSWCFTYYLISPTCHSAVLSPRFSVWAILLWFVNLVSVHRDWNTVQGGKKKKKKDLIIAISKYLNHILKASTSWRNYSLLYSNNAKIIMKDWHLIKQFYLYRPQGKTWFENTSNFMTPKPKY